MSSAYYREEYYPGNNQAVPVLTRESSTFNDFVAQTWRFFFCAIGLTMAGAALAFGFPIPLFDPVLAITLELLPFFGFLWYHYVTQDYSKAFYAFLLFAGILGLVLGPQLALIAATIPSGMFIILSALCTTAAMTFMLHNYAWLSLQLNFREVSLFGSFLSTALTGLLIVGLVSLLFPTPLGMMLYSAAGVGVFSLYLVYDVYLLKIGAYKTPLEAAMNLFLDVLNLFLELTLLFLSANNAKNSDFGKLLGEFFVKRVLPILFIVAIIVTIGLLEKYIMKDSNRFNQGDGGPDQPRDDLGYRAQPGYNDQQPSGQSAVRPGASPPQNPGDASVPRLNSNRTSGGRQTSQSDDSSERLAAQRQGGTPFFSNSAAVNPAASAPPYDPAYDVAPSQQQQKAN